MAKQFSISRSVKFFSRTLNEINSSIEINIIFTRFIGWPNISHEFTKKITKMFTKLLQKPGKAVVKRMVKIYSSGF